MSPANGTVNEYPLHNGVGSQSRQSDCINPALAFTPSFNDVNVVQNFPATNTGPIWNELGDSMLRALHDQQGLPIDFIATTYFPGFSSRELLAILPHARDRLMTRAQSTYFSAFYQEFAQQPQAIYDAQQHGFGGSAMHYNQFTQQCVYTPALQIAPTPTQQHVQSPLQQPTQLGTQQDTHMPAWQHDLDGLSSTPIPAEHTQPPIQWDSHTPIWQHGFNSDPSHAAYQPSLQQDFLPLAHAPLQPYMQQFNMQELPMHQSDMQLFNMQESEMQQLNMQEPNMQQFNMQESNVQESIMQQFNIEEPDMQQFNMQEPHMQQFDMQESDTQESNVQQPGMQQFDMQPQLIFISQAPTHVPSPGVEGLYDIFEDGMDTRRDSGTGESTWKLQ